MALIAWHKFKTFLLSLFSFTQAEWHPRPVRSKVYIRWRNDRPDRRFQKSILKNVARQGLYFKRVLDSYQGVMKSVREFKLQLDAEQLWLWNDAHAILHYFVLQGMNFWQFLLNLARVNFENPLDVLSHLRGREVDSLVFEFVGGGEQKGQVLIDGGPAASQGEPLDAIPQKGRCYFSWN